ncbi:protein piccolo isoform X3 [Pristis pectinata]|uniref:protein piccolo isoform X3 n=1 Tax=Pristis pectinata TaxID=685728 RepID=UPI00223D8F18|nr:protein piccolo isoform X3 [Pristis pectinata]
MGSESSAEANPVPPHLLPPPQEPDLRRLSDEERRQIRAVMSAGRIPQASGGGRVEPGAEPQPGAGPGPPAQEPPARAQRSAAPGAPPPPRTTSMMPSFLSDGRPLSAVSSVVNKFGLFDSKVEPEEAARRPAPAPRAPPGARDPGTAEPPASAPRTAPGPPGNLCPVCASAELGAANCSRCTQCGLLVCAQCGFNPNPHISQVKEWLCLNCQMQRALGMDVTSAPGSKPQPLQSKQGTPASAPQAAKQGPAQQTTQKEPTQRLEQAKPLSQAGPRKQPLLTKQKSMAASPPQKPKQPSHGPPEQQPLQQTVQKPKPVKASPQVVSTTQTPERQQPSPGAQQKDSKQTKKMDQTATQQPAEKQKDSDPRMQPQQLKMKGVSAPEPEVVQKEHVVEASQSTQAQKPTPVVKAPQEKQIAGVAHPLKQPALKVESKTIHPKEETGKPSQRLPAAKPLSSQIPPESQRVQKPPEQSRRFSLNLGGSTQPPQFQPTTPQESVTGKLFGFGASLFSQASTLISTTPQQQDQHKLGPKQHPAQPTPAASGMSQKSFKPDTGKREIKAQAAEKLEQKATVTAQGTKETGPAQKVAAVKQTAEVLAKGPKPMEPKMGAPSETTCPLCKTDLNIGSNAAPNYNTCTECKTVVCNLCGFNPMPHLTEVEEWLCLTCQTQRALSGQLGDPGKMPPLLPMSSKPPVKQSSPGLPPPKQQPSPPSTSSSPSKPSGEQTMVPQPKETEQEKARTSQVAETKEAVSIVPAKPAETTLTTKQDAALEQELHAPKPGTREQPPSAEEKQFQSIPEQTVTAEKQDAESSAPKHLQVVTKHEAAEIKDVKAEEALSITGLTESRSEVTKEQTEQLRKPEQVEKVKEKVTTEKEEDKSDSSALLQQRSPQGLSDTGYSSDGISSSLGEITTTLPSEDKDLLKEPVKKDSVSQESSPSSPSDLAKLESTVLSILEAQANTQNNEKPGQYKDPYGLYNDQERERHRPRTLPITPESYSSDEEDLEDIQEEDEEALEDENHGDTLSKTEMRETYGSQDEAAMRRQRYDSLEDSSESEHSPRPHRQRTISVGSSSSDSHGSGDEEEFIRKQIIEMSAEEDESGSDEDEFIRAQLKEISTKERPESKGSTVKHRRLSKKSSTSHDDDPGRRHSWHDDDDDEVYDESPDAKYRETKSQDNEELSVSAGGGLRRFKTIDLNSSIANKYTEDSVNKKDELYYDEEPELEMESLTDSPEDRSRGEGSSSLHATSSFTPGTSPTSVSSLDEDSDSSPGHKTVLGESKQQRKARHRSHGPLLPTIEDSSEEEELREEEELLREQEKQRELEQQQRKSSTKKSKKDKDELRAQRRRERPKTPPSNLSPIEDASPTEELRQAAEMEELHRSSCSEYSPSIESESEGFEISPEKILEVQKVYKLPTSVLLYSPTDDKTGNIMEDAISRKSLKSAEEAYEEMMQKAKLLQNQKGPDEVFEKEPLYGGMLIEDYIYESLVEDTYNGTTDNHYLSTGQDTGAGLFQEAEKKLRSPDEIYEEIMKKSPTYSDTKQYCYAQPLDVSLQQQQLLSSMQAGGEVIVTHSSGVIESSTNMDKQLLDADTAYEELMKRQRALLTPGTSPTQPSSPESPVSAESDATHISVATFPSASTRVRDELTTSMPHLDAGTTQTIMTAGMMHSIPDVKITQHFTTEEDIETEYTEQYCVDKGHDTPEAVKHSKSEATTSSVASTTATSTAFATPTCTIPSTVTTAVCYTMPVEAKDSVTAGKSTSEESVILAPTSTSTVKVTTSPLTCAVGRTSHVYFVTAPSELATMADHVIISVPPTLESSEIPNSAAVASLPEATPSIVGNTYTKVVPSVSVTICGGPDTTQPIPKATLASIVPVSENEKITTASSTASVSTASTAVFTTVTCTAPQRPQTTSWDPSLPFKVGPFVTRPTLQSVIDSQFPPPPPPPPLPPLTFPKPFIIPKKSSLASVPTCGLGSPIHTSVRTGISDTSDQSSLTADGKLFHAMPPPVPPKPASIPSGLGFPTKPTDGIRPAIPPKPSLTHLPLTVHQPSELQQKTTASTTTLSLNLTSPGDFKLTSPTSPMSPLSNKASPKLTLHSQATYVVITLPSEPGTPTESITCQSSPTQLTATVTKSHGLACLPSTISLAHFTQSLETQKIVEKGKTETVYFYQSLAQGVISTVARELSAKVTQVPVVYNTVPSTGALSVSISIPPDSKYSEQTHLQETKRTLDHTAPFLSDVIDLRTLSSLDSAMTDNGMDLSTFSVDGRRQDLIVDAGSGRQGSVVQPAIVNLSTTGSVEQMPFSTLALPATSVAAVPCSTSASFTADSFDGPVDLGHAVSLPLQLTAKFDDAAITHGQPAGTSMEEIPINLTCSTTASLAGWPVPKPSTIAPTGTTNGWVDIQPAEVAAVDLSTTKPHRMMVALDDLTSGIVTAIVEEEDKPVDLTAGRQNVCCDVVYKFPFGRSCSSLVQEPASTLPEDRYGYRDDHYVYDRSGPHGYRGIGSMKPSMSDTNLAEAGVFLYKSKHSFDSIGTADIAVDLTAGKLTTVCTQPQDHLSKGALSYPETRPAGLPQYSQARIIPTIGSHYGMPSVLRSSGGIVYSSVATPIPSTFAITTQPGSIFSQSLSLHTSETSPSISGLPHSQPAKIGRELGVGLPLGLDTSTFQSVGTEPLQSGPHITMIAATHPDSSSRGSFMPSETDYMQKQDIDSPAVPKLSPVVSPTSEENKHLLMEREMLEFEKMKQIRLAEELERERHEIQIFREQEKLIVQRELQELQTMKQQLLYQQEEERQAQFMMQQETIAQQQMQLEQIQQLQQQLQQQLEEQKIRQIYQYSYDPSGVVTPQTSADQAIRESQYTTADNGQFWHAQEASTSVSAVMGHEVPQTQSWYAVQSDGIPQHMPRPCLPSSVSEMSLKDVDVREGRPLRKRSSMPRLRAQCTDDLDEGMQESKSYKKIVDSGVQTDDEEGTERSYTSRRRRSKKSVDSSVQTDDEDNQEDWDIPTRRRKSRGGKYADGGAELDKAKRLQLTKLSNIAVQTVAEISVQTEPEGIIRTPSIRARIESKIEIVKHISAPEKTYKGESLGCQTEADSDGQSPPYLSSKVIATASPQKSDKKRPTPLEIGYSTHLRADSSFQVVPSPPKSPKVLYSPISPMSPNKELEAVFEPYDKSSSVDIISQKLTAPELPKGQPLSPRTIKVMQRSMSDPKPLSPTAEESSRLHFQYSDSYMTKSSQSITPAGTQKKVKRTLPNPPPEEASAAGNQATFSNAGSVSRRRVCRTNTMARAKILQDIDRELELVERESSKLRKKQAELDEEEKEIDAKLRYLEMGINRRKEALLKEREKRERAYLQGVAEERDYMSDSEVSNIRETRMDGQRGLERPRTAPQSDYEQFLSSQTQSQPQYATTPSHYTQYQYSTPTPTQAQTQYQQQSLYHQQVSPYQTQPTYQAVPTITYQQQQSPASQGQSATYPHSSQVMMIQQKPRQTALVDLEPKITTNYEVIHNQPVLMASTSTDTTYAVPHLSSKYSNLDLRIGLDERGTMVSSPMSGISADSYYTDLEHHAPRNYVLIDDIGELTKGSSSLTTGFNLHNIQKEVQKSERLLRASEARRAGDVKDFIGTLQTSTRLHSYGKAEEDSMEDPYELKLLKQQIKQEFRRGTEGLEHLSGLPHYYHGDSSYRHFAKSEKYSISRLTLEKQAAKQLPPSFIYQKQSKHKKQLLDPKISKFLPIQEARDVEAEYASYMGSTPSASGVSSRARLIQDDITFGLRKNIRDQQKFLGPAIRSTLDDEIDKAYTSGTRSRPSSVYGLDLSIKRDPSSTSLRIKSQENDPLDMAYAPSGRTKPSSLPISHSRGRIPIVAQNSEEESPLSPVGQPMGMARAAAGPLPPISADTREQFGSSHSLPEVQQHMREESRTRGYDRDIAFIMDDFQHAMSDSEGLCTALNQLTEPNQTKFIEINSYHLRREETDWFDKPRESRIEDVPAINRKVPEKLSHSRQSQPQSAEISGKPVQYNFPHSRVRVQRDMKDQTISGNGLGIRIIGGKEIPGRNGEIGAYVAKVVPGGSAEQTGKLTEGMQVLEWNGIPLTGKTYEEVQCVIGVPVREAEICVRLDLNMLSDSEKLQHLDLKDRTKAGEKQRSPGVDPKQLAAELQKVSQQAPCVVSSATEKGAHSHSGTTSAASSAAPSPGQPASPSISKKRHSSKPPETASKSHPITGEIQLQMNYDKQVGNLIVHVLQARDLAPRDNNGYSDPFVKVYLLPGRGQVMVVQNASVENKRRTKHVQKSLNPEWNQTVIYKNITMEQLKKKTLEVTVWDYDRISSNDFLGEVLIDLSNTSHFDNTLRWYPLKEQTESIDQVRSHSGQSSQQLPKTSVIKSRSHGIFPDPSKEMHVPTIEKSQSSPASSKSSSEGHLRSHGPSRSQSKSSVTQTHLEDAGAAIAAAEAAVQQLRVQPTHKSGQAQNHARKHRHSIAGVPIQRTQSDNLPSPANENKDQSQLAIRKVMSEGSPKAEGAKSTNHRPGESSISTASSVSSAGSGYNVDSEGSTTGGECNLFTDTQMGKMSQDSEIILKEEKHKASDQFQQQGLGPAETNGKTQVMGEIKIALKKEMKTDGEQLLVEILQCRNITYKFKSPDHLPDLYVKLYVINISTQKRIFKKKTRVCRHDREPSFNETFRFSLSPAGHSLQILLVSNGGKFMRKTLIGEAYIWLDKVDLRKRVVNWHKLLVSSTESQRGATSGFNVQN